MKNKTLFNAKNIQKLRSKERTKDNIKEVEMHKENLLCDNESNNYQQHATPPNFWISLTHVAPKSSQIHITHKKNYEGTQI